MPVGTDGSTKDLTAYENVVAIVRAGDTHGQVQIGTLVKVGQVWRLIDLPVVAAEGTTEVAASGFFFRGSAVAQNTPTETGSSQQSEKLLAELEQLDQSVARATDAAERAKLVVRRIELLEKIAEQTSKPSDRAMWVRQLADMISAEVQSGQCPDGAKRLEGLFAKLNSSETDKHLAPYVKFRQLTAEYYISFQEPDAIWDTIQKKWLTDLEQYVGDYPDSPDTAEAMLQLAIAHEFSGKEDDAKQWYARVVKSFPDSPASRKATGAQTRLDSVGKRFSLTGKTHTGGTLDLAKYRGRVVLVQYWATWSKAKADMATLKELSTKYARSFSVIGVNLDSKQKNLTDYLAENKLPWPQIFEEGGLDSRPANHFGILTLPLMVLVDKEGKVVDRNVQVSELEEAVKKLIGNPSVARRR